MDLGNFVSQLLGSFLNVVSHFLRLLADLLGFVLRLGAKIVELLLLFGCKLQLHNLFLQMGYAQPISAADPRVRASRP